LSGHCRIRSVGMPDVAAFVHDNLGIPALMAQSPCNESGVCGHEL